MIREEVLTSILRFYKEDTDDPLAKYHASCTIVWESPEVVWLKALSGTFSRKDVRELIKFGLDKNVKLMKALRASATLPFATKTDGNYCEVDLEQIRSKLEKFALDQDVE